MPGSETLGACDDAAVAPSRASGGRALVAEQRAQGGADDPAEGPLGPPPVEQRDLELGGGEACGPPLPEPAVTGLTADSARTPTESASARPMPGRKCSRRWPVTASAWPPMTTKSGSSTTEPSKVSRYSWSFSGRSPTSATQSSTS